MQVALLAGDLVSRFANETVRILKPMVWVARGARGPEISSHPCGRADIVNRARVAYCPLFSRDSRENHLSSYCLCLELCVGQVLGISMRLNKIERNEAARRVCWPPKWRPLHHDLQYKKARKIGDLNKPILLTFLAAFYNFISNSSPTSQVCKKPCAG
jgi:hypothetical protein